ncbi:hypothetical protein OK348_14280 [Flavobacterium sp. MXW15]|uniref:DUF4129 domain-containing protein n=1 Tax=Xanthomonas chitinilytica TaxID=2989819 RepID=A0ABT3JZB4_9XANT|nr:DUF4129 domain-containing protein [Xanthomonas sp. H13-6]MCW4455955.1 hypothetical protein [Flavobacterium sp. MXW15]MCW4473554.1 DUF4129 domain-containing protein [Xanthomonas sp. H13-6]
MRIDQLDVVLRARSQWEAMELGTALVRRHAAAIWKPWLLLTLPVFALLNLGGWLTGQFWLAGLLMWWLKPAFERIPLYVISRGVFGATPATADTLRAQWNWGWRGIGAYLGWRRLSPARSLLMPVDLLEGADAVHRSQRRRVLGGQSYGHATLLTWVCLHFEWMLQIASVMLVFMFVPVEMLSESLRAAWSLIGEQTPAWAKVGGNLIAWAAMTLIGPFYVGAGFGLYLNRRTELEAWDVEIAFRRLRERLVAAAPLLLVLLALAMPMLPARAQDGGAEPVATDTAPRSNQKSAADRDAEARAPLPDLLTRQPVDTAGFEQAVQRAYEDPLLGSKRTIVRWERKAGDEESKETGKRRRFDPGIFSGIGKLIALIAEWGLWILVGILVLVLLLTMRWWLPWLRGSTRRRREAPSPVQQDELLVPEVLPPDVIASARRLWDEGRPRHALALLYRASVETVCERAAQALPPGATEAQCLRASRQMPDEGDRQLFAQMVRIWQYAAYAGRIPGQAEFESLLQQLQQQYRWSA